MKRTATMLLAVAPYALGMAQVPAMTAPADSSQVLNLSEVEVTATRADARTPVAFTNISGAQIAKMNDGRDLPYLLAATPSVVTTSDAGAGVGYTSIRVRGSDASRINVTTNGIPVNDAESHNVYWVNMPDMAASVQDVQIQRGAGTSTNGAGAFGASINLSTTRPHITPYADLDLGYGMYNTTRQSLRAGTGLLGQHWSVDCRLSHLSSDGYIDRAWSRLWSYFGQVGYYNGPLSLRLVAFGGKERTYMAWDYASREEMDAYGRRFNPCGLYYDSEGNMAFYPNQVDNYAQHHFQLHYNHRLGSSLHLNISLHYTKGDGYYEQYKRKRTLVEYGLSPYLDFEGNEVSKSDLVRYKNMNNGFGGTVFSLTCTQGRVHSTVGGAVNGYRGHHFGQVGWVRNYIGSLDPLQEYYRNRADKTDANIYARANVDIYHGLSGYVDLQYRHIAYTIAGVSDTYDWITSAMQVLDIDRRFNFFNPKAGLNWQPNGHHRAYASYSVAHKEPTRDNFIDCSPDHLPVAERLDDWEAGYEYRSRLVAASVNLYYMDYRNQLVPTGRLSDTGNAVSENVPRSWRMGIEASMSLKPVKWLDWHFTTTLSRNRVRNFVEYIYEDEWTNPIAIDRGNTPLSFSPAWTFHSTLHFNYRIFEASLATQYVGRQYLTNTGQPEDAIPHYCTTDLHLRCTLGTIRGLKELAVGLAVYNIFNAKYVSNGYAGAGYYIGTDGAPVIYRYAGYAAQAPAHVAATLTVKF